MNKQKFYITTTIYYVNDVPHIGHAYTTLAADIVARYWQQKIGKEYVFFLTGTDEHGQKIQQAAAEHGQDPKVFADTVVPRFQEAWKLLNIKYDHFIRTTDPRHEKVALSLLQKIYDNGYIYKGVYEGLYCVGCEKFLTETDLVEGKCPLHPNKIPVHQKEENYFLKLKDLSKIVLQKIENNEYEILPNFRKNEIVSRLKQGVEDISVSRAGVSWGIPVPWDNKQTIYVWVEALMNYYSATQFLPGKKIFWPADLHLIGKDILWFHSVIWQALLIAGDIELPKAIFAHGFFTIDGQKISKSLGNVIAPNELTDKYGTDGTRYLIISSYPFGTDGDISFSRFTEKYNADLANGLGNLVARIAKLAEQNQWESTQIRINRPNGIEKEVGYLIEHYQLDKALDYIKGVVSGLDQYLDHEKPWKKNGSEANQVLSNLIRGAEGVTSIIEIAEALKPFLPETAEKILTQFSGTKIKSQPPLFPRIN